MIWSYLVQDETGKVTDFISFYALNSQVLNHEVHKEINAAYAFYNFAKDNDKERMKALIKDLLIIAKQEGFDVFNMTEVLNHGCIQTDLMFKQGDGRLAHYFYNYRIQSIKASDIGIVLV